MTKLELMEMLKDVKDDEVLTFVVDCRDRDGYPYDGTAKVYKVLGGEVEYVTLKYGITRLQKKEQ